MSWQCQPWKSNWGYLGIGRLHTRVQTQIKCLVTGKNPNIPNQSPMLGGKWHQFLNFQSKSGTTPLPVEEILKTFHRGVLIPSGLAHWTLLQETITPSVVDFNPTVAQRRCNFQMELLNMPIHLKSPCLCKNHGIQKGESGLFMIPVLTLWGSGHITRHIWRWVIVPSDLARSFGAICAHYRYRSIHRAITNMHVRFEFMRERQLTLN